MTATSGGHTGLIQVYSGDGKGKTMAAIGLAVRAAGHRMRTYFGQFLKGRALLRGESDLVVLDEVNLAPYFGLVREKAVVALLAEKLPTVELVLTGRRAPAPIREVADLVTEMVEVKQPYRHGSRARRGIKN
jgi:cob(I)alamin adenosyltransferase